MSYFVRDVTKKKIHIIKLCGVSTLFLIQIVFDEFSTMFVSHVKKNPLNILREVEINNVF